MSVGLSSRVLCKLRGASRLPQFLDWGVVLAGDGLGASDKQAGVLCKLLQA